MYLDSRGFYLYDTVGPLESFNHEVEVISSIPVDDYVMRLPPEMVHKFNSVLTDLATGWSDMSVGFRIRAGSVLFSREIAKLGEDSGDYLGEYFMYIYFLFLIVLCY